MSNPNFDNDHVLALAERIDLDHPPLTMQPIRQILADGQIRTFEAFVDCVIQLGCRAGRNGLDVAAEFLQELLVIHDLTDDEIDLLRDVVEGLGGGADE